MSNEKKLPDWTHVPEWANYRTIDANGDLFYHKEKPYIFTDQWLSDGEYLFCGKVTPFDGWDRFVERRPEPQTQDNEPPQINQPVNGEWFIYMGFQFHKKSETFIIPAMRGGYNYDIEVDSQFVAIRDIEKGYVTILHDTEYHGAITQEKVLHTLMLFN